MGSAWVFWRVTKFLALAVMSAGLWSAITSPSQASRRFAAHWLTTSGFLGSWIAGYALMKLSARSLDGYILVAMASSLVASSGALIAAERPRATPLAAALVAAGYASAIGAMVTRDQPELSVIVLAPLVLGVLAAALTRRAPAPTPTPDATQDQTARWFFWVARLEGASLILMVCVAMPLRRLTGVSLDGGQGWIGWVHGALVLVYLQALVAAALAERWSVSRSLLGFLASLLPGGTFVFERRVSARAA